MHHHHHHERVSYLQATQCEKVIYYGAENGSCHHKQHITQLNEKCWLCDNIRITPQILFNNSFQQKELPELSQRHTDFYNCLHSVELSHITDRGPPHFLFNL